LRRIGASSILPFFGTAEARALPPKNFRVFSAACQTSLENPDYICSGTQKISRVRHKELERQAQRRKGSKSAKGYAAFRKILSIGRNYTNRANSMDGMEI
jgi:hypothetical protein